MNRMVHIAWIVVIVLSTGSCDLLPQRSYCGQAPNLVPLCREVLRCAGWLDLVETHVGRIDYIGASSFKSKGEEATGAALCGVCRIKVAVRGRSKVDILRTIVHEATHLQDDCRNGEAPADRAAATFTDNLYPACAHLLSP